MAKEEYEKYGKKETEMDEVKEGHSPSFLRGAAKKAEKKSGKKEGKRGSK